MNHQRPLGLVGAGSAAGSFLARLPEFRKRLGPVKSISLRVASRLANTLGAGFPVSKFEELDVCDAIFIIVPDSRARSTIKELTASRIRLDGKSVILGDTWLGSEVLESVALRGAETGSVCLLEFSADVRFLMEGARHAVTEVKRILRHDARSLTVAPESKPLVQAALTLSESLLFPLLGAADECLRYAGIPHLQAGAFLEAAAVRASRAYGKSGRKAWTGPLADGDTHLMKRQAGALAKYDPALLRFFLDQCQRALQYYGREAKWLSTTAEGEISKTRL